MLQKKIRNKPSKDKLSDKYKAARFLNALSVNLKLSEHPDYSNRLLGHPQGFWIQQVGSTARNLHF